MTDRPAYAILVCEGRRCVPILDLAGEPVSEGEAVVFLRHLAVRLRGMRALGNAVLLERRSGGVIASRRIWP